MFVCVMTVLPSTVFLLFVLSVSVGQNITSVELSNVTDVTGPMTADSFTSQAGVTSAMTSSVSTGGVTASPITTDSPSSHTEVYLKRTESYGSPLNISVVLDVRSSFELSFRTCSHGILLSQIGGDKRNYFQLILDEAGSLNVSLSSATAFSSVLLGQDLNDNQYYKFTWTYRDLGNVTISVERSLTVLDEMVLSFATVGRDLWTVNLRNGSELHVGDGWFEGCLRDGPQRWFLSVADVDDSAVQWDSCPSETVCNHTVDDCTSSLCAKNTRFDDE